MSRASRPARSSTHSPPHRPRSTRRESGRLTASSGQRPRKSCRARGLRAPLQHAVGPDRRSLGVSGSGRRTHHPRRWLWTTTAPARGPSARTASWNEHPGTTSAPYWRGRTRPDRPGCQSPLGGDCSVRHSGATRMRTRRPVRASREAEAQAVGIHQQTRARRTPTASASRTDWAPRAVSGRASPGTHRDHTRAARELPCSRSSFA